MKRKFFTALVLLILLFSGLQIYSNENERNLLQEIEVKSTQESKNLLWTSNANWKNYLTTSAEIIVMNIGVYDFCTIIMDQSWLKPNPSIMWKNLTSPWIWDVSSFLKNQAAHPYFGNMYFTAARSNGLNFWQSLLMTAGGSFMWENCIEAGNNSLNDFLTTTFSGAVVGEVLYRLGNEAARIHPLLGSLFNPVGGINSILTGRKLGAEKSSIQSLSFDLGFAVCSENVSSYDNNVFFTKDRFLPSLYFNAAVVYGNPYGHETKEFMDQFNAKISGEISTSGYFVKANFDGEFYSVPLYIKDNAETNAGASFDYDIYYSDSSYLSLNSIGGFFKQKINFSENYFAYGLQTDFVIFGATENCYVKSEKYADPGTATYTFGPEIKIHAEYNSPVVGKFNVDGQCEYLMSYGNTPSGKKLSGNFLIFNVDASYKHKIYKNFSAGFSIEAFKKIRTDEKLNCEKDWIMSSVFLEYGF